MAYVKGMAIAARGLLRGVEVGRELQSLQSAVNGAARGLTGGRDMTCGTAGGPAHAEANTCGQYGEYAPDSTGWQFSCDGQVTAGTDRRLQDTGAAQPNASAVGRLKWAALGALGVSAWHLGLRIRIAGAGSLQHSQDAAIASQCFLCKYDDTAIRSELFSIPGSVVATPSAALLNGGQEATAIIPANASGFVGVFMGNLADTGLAANMLFSWRLLGTYQ